MGSVPAGALEAAVQTAESAFRLPVQVLPEQPEPVYAWNASRRQYGSVEVLKRLAADAPPGAVRVLGFTTADLYIPALTFLFGQAVVNGRVALVSVARLQQEFYHMPGDDELLRVRVCKETMHELGHTFGLVHCPDRACVMSLATGIAHVDLKTCAFCDECRERMEEGRAAALLAGDGAAI